MRARTVLAVMLLVLAAASASGQVVYDRQHGRMSATYHGTPLREVLTEIGKKTGIAVYIDPAVDKSVFIETKNRPVDQVLNEIVAPLNCMLVYRGDAVTEIRIYEQTPADAMQRLGSGAQPRPAADTAQRPGTAAPPGPAVNAVQAPPGAQSDRISELREERIRKMQERKAEQDKFRKEMIERRAAQAPQ